MAYQILVASPDADFAALINNALEETGVFSVHSVPTCQEAMVILDSRPVDVIFLDGDLQDTDLTACVLAIRGKHRLCQVIITEPYDPEVAAETATLPISGRLTRPLHTPDLLKVVFDALAEPVSDAYEDGLHAFQPLEEPAHSDVEEALPTFNQAVTDLLTDRLQDSRALAALWMQGSHVTAYAGSLTPAQQMDLQALINRLWSWQDPADLVHFTRLRDGSECLLHTRAADHNHLLALVFEPNLSISQASAESNALLDAIRPALGMPPAALPDETPQDQISTTPPFPEAEPEAQPPYETSGVEPELESILDDPELEPIDLDELLGAVPSPDPEADAVDSPVTETDAFVFPWELEEPALDLVEPVDQPGELDLSSLPAPTTDAYSVLLIPRSPTTFLASSLAAALTQWLPQACMASGWRLTGQTIRPTYLTVAIQVPRGSNISAALGNIRRKLSEKIYQEFPDLKPAEPSDFWADSELILPGDEPLAADIVLEFIRSCRSSLN
jgi:CheY-like chemotaxis protein